MVKRLQDIQDRNQDLIGRILNIEAKNYSSQYNKDT